MGVTLDVGSGGVQQAPEASIGALEGSMQRGASLNVPPPVARTAGGLKGNWGLFWGAVLRDHCHAGLIWNEGTRAELREALQVHFSALVCNMCVFSRHLACVPHFPSAASIQSQRKTATPSASGAKHTSCVALQQA